MIRGHPEFEVCPDQFRHLQHIQETENAFAAILEDGSVVTWGDPTRGGDSGFVQDQFPHVRQIRATCAAFAAVWEDGGIVIS